MEVEASGQYLDGAEDLAVAVVADDSHVALLIFENGTRSWSRTCRLSFCVPPAVTEPGMRFCLAQPEKENGGKAFVLGEEECELVQAEASNWKPVHNDCLVNVWTFAFP